MFDSLLIVLIVFLQADWVILLFVVLGFCFPDGERVLLSLLFLVLNHLLELPIFVLVLLLFVIHLLDFQLELLNRLSSSFDFRDELILLLNLLLGNLGLFFDLFVLVLADLLLQ